MRISCFTLGGMATLVLLAGCATTATSGPPARLDIEGDPGISAYGQYLAGHAAVNNGATADAEGYFARAVDLDPGADRALIAMRAFTSALLAGDIAKAADLAPTGPEADSSMRHLGALVRGVEALAQGHAHTARVVLTGPDSGAPSETAAALLTPFAAAAAGDVAGSIVQPVIKNEPIAQFFASLDQGRLFERARRYDEAETAFRALIAKGDPGGIASLDLGEMLERRGRTVDALAIYATAIAGRKGDGELEAARDRAAAHGAPPPAMTLRTAAAEALIAPATTLMLDKQPEVSLAYLRLALRLDPTRDEAWVMVGDILANEGDTANARAAYAKVRPTSSQYGDARSKLAWNYQGAGDKEAALATARETLAQRPTDEDAAINLADLLRVYERYDDSTAVLDGLISAHAATPNWRLYYMRAVDFEESGRWSQAEADLEAAMKLRPDEPELLNFLGYSWIDRGVRLPEAVAMVQKAVDLQPRSGAMIDSLGWGYYRLGDYPMAVSKLEEAIVLEPGDPDVNNHLGDAYWRVGRKVEAGFQWRRVLSLDPSAKLKAEVEAKLVSGLDAPPAAPVVARQ